MTIRLMYAGNDNISCSPITVIAGNSVHTLVSNDMCIEVPGHTDYFILKEAWIKTKPYRLSSDKKQITVIWNKSGSLFLALCQMLLFQCSSFYFKAFIDNENRIVQWNSRSKNIKNSQCKFWSRWSIRLLIECGIFGICVWCGSFLGRMIATFFR